MKDHKNSTVGKIITLIFWIAAWKILSLAVAKPLLLPSPESVLHKIMELAITSVFWSTIAYSMIRVISGILVAVVLGILCAILTSWSAAANMLLSPVFSCIKATPVASFTILVLVWLDRNYVPVLISGLMVFPVIWANVSAGIQNTSCELLEMAKVYGLSKELTFRRIYYPSVKPHFLSACRSVIGFGWKAGIAAEVLTVPGYSIGKMIYESKLYLQTTELFAWTVTVIILSLLLEKTVMALFGGRK